MSEAKPIAPRWSVRFVDAEPARHAAEVLGWFGIGTRLVGEIGSLGREWVVVTIDELPAEWVHTAHLVVRGQSTTSPERTELDEHDVGRSTWWDDE